jgi:hypothetical protein
MLVKTTNIKWICNACVTQACNWFNYHEQKPVVFKCSNELKMEHFEHLEHLCLFHKTLIIKSLYIFKK